MSKPIYLVVTPFFPTPTNWRGPFVLDQVKAIQRNSDFEVIVYRCYGLKGKHDGYEIDGFHVRYTPALFMPSYFFNGLTNHINRWLFLRTLSRDGIDISDIEVVHSHTAAYACFSSIIKKVNPKVKSLVQYHDPDPYQICLGTLASWRPNLYFRVNQLVRQLKYIDAHICISEKVQNNLLNFPTPSKKECYTNYLCILKHARSIIIQDKIKTILLYNGVDTSVFRPIEGYKNSGIFKIGCVGNFLDWKDQMTLLKALKILLQKTTNSNIKVYFIGSGSTKDKCQQYVIENNLENNVVFETEVHHEDLPKFYNSLDLFVLPSYFEGFGCVFTEAAACGVPFIGCKYQGYSEYIASDDTDKWLFEPKDYCSLADLIEQQYLSSSKQQYCQPYDIDVLIKRFLISINAL